MKKMRRENNNSTKKNSVEEESGQGRSFSIVGIGASAGGLEAFEQFFSKMPPDSGMAFVLIPHLDPTHASMMTELLKRVTKMEVTEAKDGMKVKPDHVYVIPPNKEMSIFHGTLNLEAPTMAHGLRMPIDAFFRSLAEDQGEVAIGIILSGTGTDGTLGVRAIHGSGGIVMVQEPKSAKYAGMPSSAVQTGLVDYILPADKIPSQLVTFVKKFVKKGKLPVTEKREYSLNKILASIRSRTGHDFSLYKKTTLNRRIEKRMNVHNIDDINTYVRYLQEHPDEVQLLFKDLLIGVTQFFRDPDAFEVLRRKVLAKYLENKPDGYIFRAWVPGCGTGEEAFSIAIVLMECVQEAKRDVKVQIFGTDIDEDAINHARAGVYSSNIAADISPDHLKRFFTKEDGNYRVKKDIRETVVFAVQDIVTDPPFTKLDLLSCRNLLIYLEPELQNRLLPLFHYSLKPDGILFLGTSETIGKYVDLFEISDKKWKFFKSKKVVSALQEEVWSALPWTHAYTLRGEAEDTRKPKQVDVAAIAQSTLLDAFAPPSVIVNEKGDILYIHGQTGKYLEPAPGHASLNILDMAREGIKFELRSGIHYVGTKMKERQYQGLQLKTNGGHQPINLMIKPILQSKEVQGLVMVTFEEVEKEKPKFVQKKEKAPRKQDKRSQEIEQELAYTRETLQTTIEELQASNEELKSTNEELQSTNEEFQSTNEELETSREELQSVNEELVTLNSELQAKIDQLSQAESDMKILLDSTHIGTIFLDSHLCIKRFTSEATRIFNLIPGDIGRPMHDIRSNLQYDDIERDCQKVLDTLQQRELEVPSKDGRLYLMRVIPYRTSESLIEGVVLTFTETTQLRELSAFKAAKEFAESVIETIREPLLILDEDFHVISANWAFYGMFRVVKEETVGRLVYELGDHQWDIPDLRRLLGEILPHNEHLEDFVVEHDFPGIGPKRMLLNARKIVQKEINAKPTILLAIEDVTTKT
jgi:two-component system CheB/CheR fusion protein